MTTREKIRQLTEELSVMDRTDFSGPSAQLAEMYMIVKGFGFDPIEAMIPQSDAEADQLVDQLLALLFHIRGDDLPPFDLHRHMLDAGEDVQPEPVDV